MTWPTRQLGEFIRIKHGFAFKGEHFTDSGDYIVLTPGNFRNEGGLKLKGDREKFYAIRPPDEFVLSEGDLLIVMTDLVGTAPMLGGSLIIPEGNKYLHNQRLGLVRLVDQEHIRKQFLHYLLNTPAYRGQIRGSASGATVRHTAPERIYRASVAIPPLAVQDAIVSKISAYDKMIENNRRRITLLENAARMIYGDWFLRLQFPGHEHTEQKNGVPDGWKVEFLPNAIEFNPREKLASDNITFVPMNALSESGMTVDEARFEKRDLGTTVKFRNGDTLLARITPCLENGKTAFVGFLNDNEVASGSTELIVMRGVQVGSCYTYCLARSEEFRGKAIASMTGSSGRQRVQVSSFAEFPIAVPPAHLVEEFEGLVRPHFDQIWRLVKMNAKLHHARGLLLPRLMAGEIIV